MYGGSPGPLVSRLVGLCVQFLICALAIYWAVQLLQSVWLAIDLIAVSVGVVLLVAAWVRHARRGW